MAVERQLTVGWQNRPGELANFCEALATAGVNIIAMATAEAGEYGAVRVLVDVDDVDTSRQLFKEQGVAHTSIEVLVVELGNQPGALASVARALADHRISIEYFYASAPLGGHAVIGVFKVSDPYAADKLLAGSDETTDSAGEG